MAPRNSSKQDQVVFVKTAKYLGSCLYAKSYLMWSPVIAFQKKEHTRRATMGRRNQNLSCNFLASVYVSRLLFFTLNRRSFYPSTSSTTCVRAGYVCRLCLLYIQHGGDVASNPTLLVLHCNMQHLLCVVVWWPRGACTRHPSRHPRVGRGHWVLCLCAGCRTSPGARTVSCQERRYTYYQQYDHFGKKSNSQIDLSFLGG